MKHVYLLNTAGGWRWLIALLAVLICTTTGKAQVSGVVFRDFDLNGIRSDTLPVETGVGGVVVRAFVDLSKTPISTTTTADGRYSFSREQIPAGLIARIEFVAFRHGDHNGPFGVGSATSVQFVRAPFTTLNLGINYPADYCQLTNIQLVTPCYINGNTQVSTDKDGNPVPVEKQAALADALVSFPYDASGVAGPGNFPPNHLATAGQVGSVWALAYQRQAKKIISAAVVKRHMSFGPGGPGGLYLTDITTGTTTTFMDVSSVGIDMGDDPHNTPLANLFGDKTQASTDPNSMTAVGRMSFGGMDMSEDDKTLYFINLKDRKLYSLFVDAPAVAPTSATAVSSWSIPNPGCSNGDYRPWAVKVYRGEVYVSVVCSAETSQLPADLKATIYRFDPKAATPVFEEVLSFPLDFRRGPADLTGSCISYDHWLPWTDAWPAPCGTVSEPKFVLYPQPILTDLEFDNDGSLLIGFLDRFGHLAGVANHDPSGNGFYDGFTGGDLLRAYNNNGTYVLEQNGTAGPLTGNGVGNNEGPGGGEFFGKDNWFFIDHIAHAEVTNGGLSLIPGYNEIITSAFDPIENVYQSGGLKVFNTKTGDNNRNYVLYTSVPGSFGKASGLGDSKPLCDPAPVEIGNRFWFDDDRDGIQDAYEPGIDGVVLTLHDMEDDGRQVGTQTTHDGGQFYFNNTTVPVGIRYNHKYEIRMDTLQLPLLDITLAGAKPIAASGGRRAAPGARQGITPLKRYYWFSPAKRPSLTEPELRDSDAQLVGGSAVIAVVSREPGQNDFTNDLSVYSCPEFTGRTDTLARCSGMKIDSVTTIGSHLSRVDSVRFVLFSSPQSGTAIYGNTGTVIGTVKPDSATGRAVLRNPPVNTVNNTVTSQWQYVYAIIYPIPENPACRQSNTTILLISPALSASVADGAITCSNAQVTLAGQAHYGDGSVATKAIYQWTGPEGFASTQQNPTVTVAGNYTLTVSDPACSVPGSQAVAVVTGNTAVPTVDINSLTLTCGNPSGTLSASVTGGTAPYTYRWSKGAATQTITVSTAVPYSVTVTGTNGCITTATTSVLSDSVVPTVSINSLILTCTNPTGTLMASVTGGSEPYTYRWSTNAITPGISAGSAGSYSVVITGANGCSISAIASVASGTDQPSVSINALTLSCTTLSGTLMATAAGGTAPYTYLWSTGANTASIPASAAGPYSVTVTGANGCITMANTSVVSETVILAVSVNNLELTCASPSGTLSASVVGGIAPYTYLWNTGQTTARITTSTTGPYSVTVTGSNGCSTTAASTIVTSNIVTPVMTTTVVARTCAGCPATVAATSPGSVLSWTGPNNFAAIGPGAQVSVDGTYVVTATASNGCTVSARLAVVPFLCPELSTGQLSLSLCSGMSLDSLTATTLRLGNGDQVRFVLFSSPQSGTAMYENSGQVLGSIRPRQTDGQVVLYNPVFSTVNTTGSIRQVYIYATVYPMPADPACRQSSQTVLNISPAMSASASGGEITCSVKQVTLAGQAYYGGGTPASGVLYSWSGPNGFSSNQQNPTVSVAGSYTITVSNPACSTLTSRAVALVTTNIVTPVMTTTLTARTCAGCSATVAATSPGSVLSWTGPNNFAAIGPGAQVSVDGTYVVTATASNGCWASASLAVVPFACPPATCMPIIVRRNRK